MCAAFNRNNTDDSGGFRLMVKKVNTTCINETNDGAICQDMIFLLFFYCYYFDHFIVYFLSTFIFFYLIFHFFHSQLVLNHF